MGPLDNDGLGFGEIGYRVSDYIEFAYKLWLTPSERKSLLAELPKWATTKRFDIQARLPGHTSKDQKRLMMQSLLAERFKLAVHFQTQQVPVFALVLLNSGETGPQLRPHPETASCPAPPVPSDQLADGFPAICKRTIGLQARAEGHVRVGARNVAMTQIANALTQEGSGVDRPVLDRTGLTGEYDFAIEFTPEETSGYIRKYGGPAFTEALRDQLGLELEPTTGPVDVLVIDHIEEPLPN
jgi:bla regulator protein blaR1